MSKVKIQGHASGSGTLTLGAPNTDSDRTITLPDTTGTLLDENSSVPAANITGNIASARLTSVPAANVTGTLPASVLDTTTIENNIAMLAFFRASDNSKAKYSLVDQVVDEYTDATGVDAGNSTNEALTSGYYSGNLLPTHDADYTGVDGNDTWYKWTDTAATGTFTPAAGADYEVLVVAVGGGGGRKGGGGGAGGYRTGTLTLSAQAYTVTVGAGGAGSTSLSARGVNGSNSIFSTITSTGGGGGGSDASGAQSGSDGGSGGGDAGGGYSGGGGGSGNTPSTSPSQGNDGGDHITSSPYNGGGGGGASAAGANAGAGGAGTANDITGSSVTYAGGGGGGGDISGQGGAPGAGGGGGGSGGSGGAGIGTNNTGGGGGGGGQTAAAGGAGGSGIVIIKGSGSYGDLTLQSVATTAESAPTTGDIVMLIEDSAGTATINTDVKAYISRDGSAFSSQVTLTDEGDWGTNKRILAAHNVDISGITSGTSMKYKITTHNQSASKYTKIHATSLAWA